MASSSFPDPVFESLLDKLAHTLEVAQKLDMEQNIETRQQLFQAVSKGRTWLVLNIQLKGSPDSD